MVPFDRSHTTSYSTFKVTICLSYAVSEIQLDEKGVNSVNKKWLPWQYPLWDRKSNFRSFIYVQSSTIPANVVKIGAVITRIYF